MDCIGPSAQVDMTAISAVLEARLSPGRYEHSLRTAETAGNLCRHFGLDAAGGYLAGLIHDCARELQPGAIASLAAEDGVPVDAGDTDRVMLLHGNAGAVIARRDFGITDRDVLHAVRNHVTGVPGMTDLSKVVFIADYLEPGRPWSSEERIRACMNGSLNAMLKEVMESIFRDLDTLGLPIAEESLILYDEVSNG